jgi:uncharacterized protein YihD (DUF1040 family)
MRDPNRIPEILAEIGKIWMNNPDLRLMQLLDNALIQQEEVGIGFDMFYVEDELVLRALKEFSKKYP